MEDVLILAIESSCDETAGAVVKNGRTVLSNIISSQIDLHTLYGGVVPEIASRKHMEQINQVINEALSEAKVTSKSKCYTRRYYGDSRNIRTGSCRCASGRSVSCKGSCLCVQKAVNRSASY